MVKLGALPNNHLVYRYYFVLVIIAYHVADDKSRLCPNAQSYMAIHLNKFAAVLGMNELIHKCESSFAEYYSGSKQDNRMI